MHTYIIHTTALALCYFGMFRLSKGYLHGVRLINFDSQINGMYKHFVYTLGWSDWVGGRTVGQEILRNIAVGVFTGFSLLDVGTATNSWEGGKYLPDDIKRNEYLDKLSYYQPLIECSDVWSYRIYNMIGNGIF